MNAFTGVPAVLLVSALGGIAIGMSGRGTGPIWALVVCATALPAIAAVNAARKARRLGGREGIAWRILALSMALMVPVYATEFIEAYALETGFIAGAYLFGALAVLAVPLPNAGPYQRMVASLDALGIGIVVATGTFWIVSASGLDISGHVMWAVSDAAIMAMIGYVAVRRSQRSGIDWSLVWLLGAVGAYLGGLLISTVSPTAYFLGHSADYAYFLGMALFAVAPLTGERREERSRHILRPVRWGHVLGPYLLVAVLAAALVVHQITVWGDDPTGTVIELGMLATMLLVLVRQLALIAEQRRKIETEQSGVIATISHELRTPLTAVVGFLDLLEDWHQFSEEDKIEMVTLMRNQSHVLARVIGDLVDVARERIEHLDLAWTDIDVDEFLAAAIALVPELNNTTLRLDVADGAGLTADRERMLQIITNYLSNAGQYGSGHVEIAVFVEAGETVIEVHDDGPGVPDIFRLVVWERFERGPQRQGAIPGSGIGLSVARGIARSHGGETYYRRSDRLGGACFSVRIPLDRFPSQRSVAASPVVTA